ncbi:MAG TPA: hypothetical protein VGE74_10295 [Gemmata sp.]
MTTSLLRVLDALTPDEVEELGKWELDKPKSEAIVDRLTTQLGEHRPVVRETLSRCLQFDVWGDYLPRSELCERTYRQCGEKDADIERALGCPPKVFAFVDHFVVQLWQPDQEGYSDLIIEDDRWGAICEGYLAAKGRAFPTTLSLLEATVRQGWPKWPVLWKWF